MPQTLLAKLQRESAPLGISRTPGIQTRIRENEPDQFCTDAWMRWPGALSPFNKRGPTLLRQSRISPFDYLCRYLSTITSSLIYWAHSCRLETTKSLCLDALLVFEHDCLHENLKTPHGSHIWETQHPLTTMLHARSPCMFLMPRKEWNNFPWERKDTGEKGQG